LDGAEEIPLPEGSEIGHITEKKDAVHDYIQFVKETIQGDLSGLRIALDCANGASYKSAPAALFQLNADVVVINDKPDGTNINANCGSTHIEQLQKFVVETGADIGLAFDGDADRVLAVDENGNLVDGDQIMAICALDLMEQNKLKGNTLVATVMSNLGLFIMAREMGIHVKQTRVGDRYVLEEMLKSGYIIGGEQSGHIIFLEHNTTGDGLVTALQLLSVLKKKGKKLSELASVMKILPQVLVNAKVSNEKKNSYMEDEIISKAINELEATFENNGRVLIRPSGTEPLVRVMIEGQDKEFITQKAKELAELIEQRLG